MKTILSLLAALFLLAMSESATAQFNPDTKVKFNPQLKVIGRLVEVERSDCGYMVCFERIDKSKIDTVSRFCSYKKLKR